MLSNAEAVSIFISLKPGEEIEETDKIIYRRHDTLLVAEKFEGEYTFVLFVIYTGTYTDGYVTDKYIHINEPRDKDSFNMLTKLGWKE